MSGFFLGGGGGGGGAGMGVIVLWPELLAEKYIMAFDKRWVNKSYINKSMPKTLSGKQ